MGSKSIPYISAGKGVGYGVGEGLYPPKKGGYNTPRFIFRVTKR